jgi:alkylation response protein AidB-like acyl-CoA dehydrogenase
LQLTDTEEQQELRASVRRFLADKSPAAEARRQIDTDEGFDRVVWRQMATQLGLQGVAIPERYGGSGFSTVEQNIVLQELGRALYGGPYFSSIAFAAQLLLALADEAACTEYLPAIADGSLLATVAIAEPGRRWDASAATVVATQTRGGWVIDGVKTVVVGAMAADLLLVLANARDGLGVFAVDARADGVMRSALPPLDLTRRIAEVTFAGAMGRRLGNSADCSAQLSVTLDHAVTAVAAEQVGGAEACLEMAVQYAKTRVQFGRPIGSFQAVKHRCADMLMRVEFAKAAAAYGSWAVANDPTDAPLAAALCKSYCSDVFLRVAADNIQVHGGIGFTWEHDAHLYFRRAKALQLFLGDAAHQRTRIAQALGL